MTTTVPLVSAVHLPFRQYRRELKWESAAGESFGFQRCVYPRASTANMSAHLTMIPLGNSWPEVTLQTDTIFVGAGGQLEIFVGDQIFSLGKDDILRLDAGQHYSYTNVGESHALLYQTYEEPGFNSAISSDPRFVTSDGPSHYMAWKEHRREFVWHAPLADQMGHHRHSGPFVETTHMRGHITEMPPGQVSAWHGVPGDVIFVQLEGEIEFECHGKIWPLEPLDIFIIPADTPYIYRNASLAPEHFFLIMSERPDGARSTYYLDDPGWPVSPDVKTYYWSHGKGLLENEMTDQ